MPSWPASLPPLPVGLSFDEPSGHLRTEMDVGPAKVRVLDSAPTRPVQFSTPFTGAQLVALATFWTTTLARGTLEFDWEDPVTDATVSYRFVGRYSVGLEAGDSDTDKRVWMVSMTLEVMP